MRVLYCSTTDGGGAGTAAYRLMKCVQSVGIDAKMKVRDKKRPDIDIIPPTGLLEKISSRAAPRLEEWMTRTLYPKKQTPLFSPAVVPSKSGIHSTEFRPDIFHLHWIADGYVDTRSVSKIDKPIVWTLHDMWTFTGGCHYDNLCGKFRETCGECPLLTSDKPGDLSFSNLQRKMESFDKSKITVVTPSNWLGNEASSSRVFKDTRIEVIPYGIDQGVFHPTSSEDARAALDLPQDSVLVLCGAVDIGGDPRKGFDLFLDAIPKLRDSSNRTITVLTFGMLEGQELAAEGTKFIALGTIADESTMALVYSAADVYVTAARQENLGNTVIESLCCGTPVVAFDIGGMPDLIDHKRTGYLASPFDTTDLAEGIHLTLNAISDGDPVRERCVEKANADYESTQVGLQYKALYEDII